MAITLVIRNPDLKSGSYVEEILESLRGQYPGETVRIEGVSASEVTTVALPPTCGAAVDPSLRGSRAHRRARSRADGSLFRRSYPQERHMVVYDEVD